MNHSMRWFLAGALVIAPHVGAQTTPAGRSPATDSIFARAKQLVVNGNGAAGRLLVDSVVAATDPESPTYAEALYWRAALAATSADAERDYRRLVVEYPLSPRSGEALFQLAQLEVARGDRPAATTHLDRFLLENPTSDDRGRAGLMLVRISFDQADPQHACAALRRALRDVPQAEVELHNQLDYYSPRCASVDSTRAPSGSPARDSAHRDTTHRDSTKHDAGRRDSTAASHTSKARYTLQVAAYGSREDAERLAKRLKARGIDVRVAGTARLFRVRIGHYETRAAAAAAARELKAKKIDAFVTEIGGDDK
jgi:tetratricopeptide (TPR) repeat protein